MATIATKVEQFIKLRNHKAAAKKAFDSSMERINQAVDKLEAEIIGALQAEGLTNAKSPSGLAYINTTSSATVKDRDAFEDWCDKTDNWAAADIRANKKVIRELLDQGIAVPGVKFSERVTIGVRSPKK